MPPHPGTRAVVRLAWMAVVAIVLGTALVSAQESDRAYLPEVEIYAETIDVSLEEGERRLMLQNELGSTNIALEEALPERLAGIWLEHRPDFNLVVWFTGADEGLEAVRAIAKQSPVEVVIRTGAPISQADLLEDAKRALGLLAMDVAPAGVWLDVRTSTIHLDLQPTSSRRNEIEKLQSELATVLQSKIRVHLLEAMASNGGDTYGGRRITTNGWNDPKCTTGFTVSNHLGATGVLTSAHCMAQDVYWNDSLDSHLTTHVAQAYDDWRDVQWHSVEEPEQAKFDSGVGLPRSVTARKSRASQTVGSLVCHHGQSTGYSCGELVSKVYQPAYTNACPNMPCAASWMRVSDWDSSIQIECTVGDSGGPWFNGNTAYGIHKGHIPPDCIYMAIDFIDAMGVYVLTE